MGAFSHADQGNSYAQFHLGDMYNNGEVVQQDYVQAHMWYSLADAGYLASKNQERLQANIKLAIVVAKMTPDQIAEAQRLAREWTAAHPNK